MWRHNKLPGLVCSAVLLTILTGCPPCAPWVMVFDQGNFGQDGYVSILDGVDYSPSPQTADRFVLEGNAPVIRVIQWWGARNPAISSAEDFVIRIFEDDGSGLPKTIPLYAIPVGAVDRIYSGKLAKPETGSWPIYEYSVELIPFDLVSGAPYYLSIVDTTGHDWIWMWTDDAGASAQAYSRTTDDEDWTATLTHDLAFRLYR